MKKRTFAVIGLDRFGYNLALNLSKLGNEVIGIDKDAEKVRKISDMITHTAIADPTDEGVIRTLGICEADTAIVALTEDIQTGVLVTLMLKELGMKNVVAECTSEIHGRILEKVGADRIVFPEKDMGERLAKNLTNTDIMDYIDLSDEYSIMEIRIPRSWAGKTLASLEVRAKYNITVIAERTLDEGINLRVDPHAPLPDNCRLIVMGPDKNIERVAKE